MPEILDLLTSQNIQEQHTSHLFLWIFSSKKKAEMGFSSENKNFIGISSLTKKKQDPTTILILI